MHREAGHPLERVPLDRDSPGAKSIINLNLVGQLVLIDAAVLVLLLLLLDLVAFLLEPQLQLLVVVWDLVLDFTGSKLCLVALDLVVQLLVFLALLLEGILVLGRVIFVLLRRVRVLGPTGWVRGLRAALGRNRFGDGDVLVRVAFVAEVGKECGPRHDNRHDGHAGKIVLEHAPKRQAVENQR